MNHNADASHSPCPFPARLGEDKGFMGFLHIPEEVGGAPPSMPEHNRHPQGPATVELGWAKGIKFDHDFVGRAALEREVQQPRRAMVTLNWNVEDLVDIYASQYRDGEPYMWMDPIDLGQYRSMNFLCADQVLKDGKEVGVSSGRAYSYYYRQMLSLCSIDVEHGSLGTEVDVLWGNPGTRQKAVRATVSRFPFLNEGRNEAVDVSAISCVAPKN
jgi:glycine cleavage system aminomethyltransferase T